MSKFSIIPARALFDTRLDQEDVLLLVVLCQYTDKSGKCWPAFETISETFSPLVGRTKAYSKASISARMDRLEAAGYVRDGGHRKNAIGGYGTKDWYVLHDGEIPAEFDRSLQAESNSSVQKSPPELNTSGQKSPIVSERNVPCLTSQKEEEAAPAENVYSLYQTTFGDLIANPQGTKTQIYIESLQAMPLDWVRESFARTVKKERASGEVWRDYRRLPYALQIAGEWKKAGRILPEQTYATKPTYSRGPSKPAAPGYTPPTEAERAAFHARLANAPKSG